MRDVSDVAPIGAIVQKRCTCGRPAQHREQVHPRYRVLSLQPNRWMPRQTEAAALLSGWARLERLDTGRVHRTSTIVLRDQYVIVSLPTEAVLIMAGPAPTVHEGGTE